MSNTRKLVNSGAVVFVLVLLRNFSGTCFAQTATDLTLAETSTTTTAATTNSSTVADKEDEASPRHYRRPKTYAVFRPAYRPQQQLYRPQYQQGPSIVGYFNKNNNNNSSSGARSCNNKQAPLPVSCTTRPNSPECTEQARQAVCQAYDDAKLTETTRVGAAPATYANITWPTGVSANLGNVLTTMQTFNAPASVDYLTRTNALYTILVQDAGQPGIPSATRDIGTPAHWLVGNIPGTDIDAGDKIFDYFILLTPPNAETPVVYNLFVYEQPSRITFTEPRIPDCSFAGRSFFSAEEFQRKYSLIGPQFGNFVRIEKLPPDFSFVGAFTARCIPYFGEQFRQANLPYPIEKGLTLHWPNNIIMGFGNTLQTAALGAEQPKFFSVQTNPTQKFTYVFFDQDANNNNDAASPKYVNWLVVNAGFREKINDGTPIIAYQRPAPANDNKPHRFVALSYLQPSGNIDVTNVTRVQRCDVQGRAQFKLDEFVKSNNLQLIDGAYSLMRFDGTQPC